MATLGYYNGGNPGASNTGVTIGFWNSKFACKFQASENGTITAITFYGSGAGATIAGYLCVYSDNAGAPDALLGSGALNIPANPAWTTVAGLAIAIIAGSYYWLTVNWGQNDNYIVYYYDAGAANQHALQAFEADAPPPANPFGAVATYSARKMSIYATYTPAAGAAKAQLILLGHKPHTLWGSVHPKL